MTVPSYLESTVNMLRGAYRDGLARSDADYPAVVAVLFESGVDYLELFDVDHSDAEDRFIAIGPIKRGVVFVVTTEVTEDTLRLISARWATKREREAYEAFAKESP